MTPQSDVTLSHAWPIHDGDTTRTPIVATRTIVAATTQRFIPRDCTDTERIDHVGHALGQRVRLCARLAIADGGSPSAPSFTMPRHPLR